MTIVNTVAVMPATRGISIAIRSICLVFRRGASFYLSMRPIKLYQMPRSVRKAAVLALAAGLVIGATSCRKAVSSVPPPVPQVVVATVVQKDVPVYSEWVGTTEGYINAQIYPKISGYLMKQNYTDGEQVRAGQSLFQIDDREYKAALDQALGDLAQKAAQFKQNEQDLARYKPLLAAQVISRQEFDHVAQTTSASKAAVQAAQAAVETAKLNVEWTRVTSPIDGIAGIAKTQVGDLVGTTSLLTTVSQLDPIKVNFPISEREYLHFAGKIREHEETGRAKDEPDLQMILADGSTYKYRGHFYVANRQVDVQTGTIKIRFCAPASTQKSARRRTQTMAHFLSPSPRCSKRRDNTRSRWSARTTK